MDSYFRYFSGSALFLALFASGFGASVARADLFVSDPNHDVVNHYDATGTFVNSSSILSPTGLAVGPDGNLYAATPYEDGSSVVMFNPVTGARIGTFTSHISDTSLNNPAGIAFDASGHLYVGDLQSKILVYGSGGGAHTSALPDADLNAPSGLAFGPSGELYVADENNGSVLRYNAGAFSILNTPGSPMNVPHDVGVGLDGNLYVLDLSGTTGGIYQLNPATGVANEIVDYSTSLFSANDLVVGPDGKIYVSGVDGNTGDGEILAYGIDGSGGGVYLNLGSGASPGYMTFSPVPEPSALGLILAGGAAVGAWRLRRRIAAGN